MLAQLKTELIQKGALYSDKHPVIQSLKRQIEAMEKAAPPPADSHTTWISFRGAHQLKWGLLQAGTLWRVTSTTLNM